MFAVGKRQLKRFSNDRLYNSVDGNVAPGLVNEFLYVFLKLDVERFPDEFRSRRNRNVEFDGFSRRRFWNDRAAGVFSNLADVGSPQLLQLSV